jgi:chromosome segregation ATPase
MLIPVRIILFVLALAAGYAVAQDSQVDSLPEAQRRLRAADEELKRAQRDEKRAENRAQEARTQVEDTRVRAEKVAQEVEAAKAVTGDAQRRYDSVRSIIEKIYESRQR